MKHGLDVRLVVHRLMDLHHHVGREGLEDVCITVGCFQLVVLYLVYQCATMLKARRLLRSLAIRTYMLSDLDSRTSGWCSILSHVQLNTTVRSKAPSRWIGDVLHEANSIALTGTLCR